MIPIIGEKSAGTRTFYPILGKISTLFRKTVPENFSAAQTPSPGCVAQSRIVGRFGIGIDTLHRSPNPQPSRVTPQALSKARIIVVAFCYLLIGYGPVHLRSGILPDEQQQSKGVYPNQLHRSLKAFTGVLDLLETEYAEPIDVDKAVTRSLQRMLRLLDPHSNFYDPKAFRELRAYQSGNYSGIGARVAPVDGQPMVLSTTPGSPASKVGLRPGDVITSVDGISTTERPGTEVVALLRGPGGTAVEVVIERLGVKGPLRVKINREEIPEPSVPLCYAILPQVIYLQLVAFTATTEDEVDRALEPFAHNMEGLVLDLRDNFGGNLQSAIAIADRFLDLNEVILVTKGRLPNTNVTYHASRGLDRKPFPLVVLINERTASAAEIVAGAIQDDRRGLVVGKNSFGKGLVQTVFPLSGGTGLSLTTAKWFTPKGRLIQRDYKNRSLAEYLRIFDTQGTAGLSVAPHELDRRLAVPDEGGIVPDILVESPKLTALQARLLSRHFFFAFAREFNAKYPVLANTAIVTPLVLKEFRRYLRERNLVDSDQEFQVNLAYIQRSLRSRLLLVSLQPQEGMKVELGGDPQVVQALSSLPQAKLLVKQYLSRMD